MYLQIKGTFNQEIFYLKLSMTFRMDGEIFMRKTGKDSKKSNQ